MPLRAHARVSYHDDRKCHFGKPQIRTPGAQLLCSNAPAGQLSATLARSRRLSSTRRLSMACLKVANSDAFATQFTSASNQSGHNSRRRSVRTNVMGRPRARRGRALSRGRATARPSPQAVSAHSGHDRSAKNSAAYATRASMTQPIRTGATVVCMLHRGSRINLYPVERQRLVPKSCILVAARLQDGWDSSLVRLIRPTRHPQSHIRPGIGPEAWAKLIQLITQ
jgi:hypothetical protein